MEPHCSFCNRSKTMTRVHHIRITELIYIRYNTNEGNCNGFRCFTVGYVTFLELRGLSDTFGD